MTLYEYLLSVGFTDSEAQETIIRLNNDMLIPEDIMQWVRLFWRTKC